MVKKYKSFLFTFDLIGQNPQLFIFSENRYKTLFSSIISVIIIIFSFIFGILSFYEYIKFESPVIVYSKDNDSKTKREIFIKDTLLMFQLVETERSDIINENNAYYTAGFSIMFDNGTFLNTDLKVENCEIGKNIDIKYKKLIEEKYTFERKLGDFYCINLENDKNSLFYYPNIGYSYITLYIIIKNNSNYIPGKVQSLIVSESDLIDHNNKSNPILQNFDYHFTAAFSLAEYTRINYNFQFIKYESDDGLFYKNSKILNGISFSDMTSFRNIQGDYGLNKDFSKLNELEVGRIILTINKSNFDNYKRVYPRFQSFLADIMSVISLLFEIAKTVTFILCDKKMSKDIIRSILNRNEKDKFNIQNSNIIMNNSFIKNERSSEIKLRINQLEDKSNLSSNLYKNNINEGKRTEKNNSKNFKKDIINNTFKKIKYFNILKSLFCFKDKKTKFIDLFHNTIIEDMSIEILLERIYDLERRFSFLLNKDTNNNFLNFKDNRYNKIIQIIFDNKINR